MFNDAIDQLFQDMAGGGQQQQNVATKEDIAAIAEVLQQIPQMIAASSNQEALMSISAGIQVLTRQMNELIGRVEGLEAKEPDLTQVLEEIKKPRKKTVTMKPEVDQWGFPEKIVCNEESCQ